MDCIFLISLFPKVSINVHGMDIDTDLLESEIQRFFEENDFTLEQKHKFAYELVEEFVKTFNQKAISNCALPQNTSAIPIHNPNDKIEVIIKNEFTVGQICKSKKEIFETIGVKNLGIKNLNGGKQKQIANDTVSQYLSMQSVNGRKQMQQITDIFEIPHLLEELDNRGRTGFYLDRGIPILLSYFQKQGENEIRTSLDNLSKVIGLVGKKYKCLSPQQLLEYNDKFTQAAVRQFYYRCKPEQEAVVFRILDRLQNDYSVISYYKNFNILHQDGTSHVSTLEEDILIRNTQRKVLNEFKVRRLMTIYQKKQEKDFFSRVCQVINDEHGLDWSNYFNQIQIFIDTTGLQDVSKDFCTNTLDLPKYREEIIDRFRERIKNRTEKDIRLQTDKNKKDVDCWLESDNLPDNIKEIKELMELGICNDDDTYRKLALSNNSFVYYDSYKDIQFELINLLLNLDPQ